MPKPTRRINLNNKFHDEVRLPSCEYNRLQRLLSSYNTLEREVTEYVEKYGSISPIAGIQAALQTVSQRRIEVASHVVERNWSRDD